MDRHFNNYKSWADKAPQTFERNSEVQQGASNKLGQELSNHYNQGLKDAVTANKTGAQAEKTPDVTTKAQPKNSAERSQPAAEASVGGQAKSNPERTEQSKSASSENSGSIAAPKAFHGENQQIASLTKNQQTDTQSQWRPQHNHEQQQSNSEKPQNNEKSIASTAAFSHAAEIQHAEQPRSTDRQTLPAQHAEDIHQVNNTEKHIPTAENTVAVKSSPVEMPHEQFSKWFTQPQTQKDHTEQAAPPRRELTSDAPTAPSTGSLERQGIHLTVANVAAEALRPEQQQARTSSHVENAVAAEHTYAIPRVLTQPDLKQEVHFGANAKQYESSKQVQLVTKDEQHTLSVSRHYEPSDLNGTPKATPLRTAELINIDGMSKHQDVTGKQVSTKPHGTDNSLIYLENTNRGGSNMVPGRAIGTSKAPRTNPGEKTEGRITKAPTNTAVRDQGGSSNIDRPVRDNSKRSIKPSERQPETHTIKPERMGEDAGKNTMKSNRVVSDQGGSSAVKEHHAEDRRSVQNDGKNIQKSLDGKQQTTFTQKGERISTARNESIAVREQDVIDLTHKTRKASVADLLIDLNARSATVTARMEATGSNKDSRVITVMFDRVADTVRRIADVLSNILGCMSDRKQQSGIEKNQAVEAIQKPLIISIANGDHSRAPKNAIRVKLAEIHESEKQFSNTGVRGRRIQLQPNNSMTFAPESQDESEEGELIFDKADTVEFELAEPTSEENDDIDQTVRKTYVRSYLKAAAARDEDVTSLDELATPKGTPTGTANQDQKTQPVGVSREVYTVLSNYEALHTIAARRWKRAFLAELIFDLNKNELTDCGICGILPIGTKLLMPTDSEVIAFLQKKEDATQRGSLISAA